MRPSLCEDAGGGPAFLALAAYWAEVMGGPPSYTLSMGDQTSLFQMHAGNGDMSDPPADAAVPHWPWDGPSDQSA